MYMELKIGFKYVYIIKNYTITNNKHFVEEKTLK